MQDISLAPVITDRIETSSRATTRRRALRFELLEAQDLGQTFLGQWSEIRNSISDYRSPFFCPEFGTAVARSTPNIRIAAAFRGSEVAGILPVQVNRRGAARPAGLGINDAHGLIKPAGESLTTLELLAECGIKNFAFHSSPPDLSNCQKFEIGRTRSFLADLTVDPQGYEHYLRSTSTTIDRQGQKTRKLVRKCGPLRFEFDCRNPELLDLLLKWKRQQYNRTHTYDILGVDWIQRLLHDLHQQDRGQMHGVLNVLYAGDVPVAMHYGMLDGDLLHYWFPVFDPQFSFGSPGTQLFLEVVRHCEAIGVKSIDMGYGEQQYKYKLTNQITETSFGLIDPSPFRRALYRNNLALRAKLKNFKLKDRFKPMIRRAFPSFGGGTYHS